MDMQKKMAGGWVLLSLEIIDWFAMLKLTWILFLHHFLVRRTAEWLGRKKGTKREGEEEQGMTKRSMLAICQRKPSSGNWRCFNCTENDMFPPSEGDGKGWVRRDQPRASSGCAVSIATGSSAGFGGTVLVCWGWQRESVPWRTLRPPKLRYMNSFSMQVLFVANHKQK